jgi:hypothetical protein
VVLSISAQYYKAKLSAERNIVRRKQLFLAALALAVLAAAVSAGDGVIGLAVTQGLMQVDRAPVEGNANLSDGAAVATAAAPTRIQLTNGSRVTLGVNSQARVYSDRLVLEQGESLLAAGGYKVEAAGFEVAAVTDGAQAFVEIKGKLIQVAALKGPVKVSNKQGALIARVSPGRALAFEPVGGEPVSTMSGALRREGNRFLLRDELTDVTVELQGRNLESEVGRRVQVTGPARASADSQLIQVARLNRLTEPAAEAPLPAPESSNQAGAGALGLSLATKVVIAAVIIGGVTTGVVLATVSR